MMPYGIRFSTLQLTGTIDLPWGEKLPRWGGEPDWHGMAARVLALVLFTWSIFRIVFAYRAGNRRGALLLLAFIAVQLCALLVGTLIDAGRVKFFYLSGFAFIILILVVALNIGLDLRQRAVQLAAAVRELRGKNLELEAARAQIAEVAYVDSITGLPNRARFREFAQGAFKSAHRDGTRGALLLLDLDHFRYINDSLGHDTGDGVLREVAIRLRGLVEARDFLANLSGDGFITMMTERTGSEEDTAAQAQELAHRMMKSLEPPIVVGDHRFHVNACVGIACFPVEGSKPYDIFRMAEIALYRAKDQGRHTVRLFQPPMRHAAEQRMRMDRHLRGALDRNELRLVYQPQVRVDGSLFGAESLLRWTSPELGTVPPAIFVPLAEENGFIHRIGAWVLREACRRIAEWEKRGVDFGGHIAVNVSPWQLNAADFVSMVEGVLAETGVRPDRLMIEITESALLFDVEACTAKLAALRAMGVRLALDDFGTGYSSLSYLQDLPLDVVKIDKSFVRRIEESRRQTLVVTIIDLAKHLGISVVAEGVETRGQQDILERVHCSSFQGYLICKPVEAEEFAAWSLARTA
jgi:diguanylate cyclase (GGDEF)-like protein